MKYRNAQDILPDKLLKELQKYAAGETLYIPSTEVKKNWGETSGARSYYKQRNEEIRRKYREGSTMDELAEEYGLSVDSIRKIV
ncbi:MAG: hypothetical protein IKK33_15190 [Lachnospiraceae bacterium]|nr:hypothetical protein [Lachnospiraceae bacterium]